MPLRVPPPTWVSSSHLGTPILLKSSLPCPILFRCCHPIWVTLSHPRCPHPTRVSLSCWDAPIPFGCLHVTGDPPIPPRVAPSLQGGPVPIAVAPSYPCVPPDLSVPSLPGCPHPTGVSPSPTSAGCSGEVPHPTPHWEQGARVPPRCPSSSKPAWRTDPIGKPFSHPFFHKGGFNPP